MSTTRRARGQTVVPGEAALRGLPARSAQFLHAAGSHDGIRELLGRGGYRADDHAEGLSLLAQVCRYQRRSTQLDADEQARAAEAALTDWIRTHLARLRAAVERLHPDALPLFSGLSDNDSKASALTIGTFLGRLDEIETRTNHAAVLRTFAQRGLDQAERQHLASLLTRARSAYVHSEPSARPRGAADPDPELLALHAWLRDWSATAKTFIVRKDWLIRLGLVRRGGSG